MKYGAEESVKLLSTVIGFFFYSHYIKPVQHPIGKEKTGKKLILIWNFFMLHDAKVQN